MYFLLDLCCKVTRADAAPQAPCTAVAPAPTHAAGVATPSAAQQPHPATPSALLSSAAQLPHAASSSSSKVQLPTPAPAAAPAAGDPAPPPPPSGSTTQPTLAAMSKPTQQQQQQAASSSAAMPSPLPSAAAAAGAGGTVEPQLGTAAAVGAESSGLDKIQEAFSHKPCRACTTAQDMLAAFRSSQFAHSSSGSSSGGSGSAGAAVAQPSPGSDALQQKQQSAADASNNNQQQPQQQPQKQPFWFYEDDMPCPPDILELGRATWTLLHSVAAYYPERPSEQQQGKMRAFVDALGEFYPCEECRGHLQKELLKHPPEVGSAADLSRWACRLHNIVNVRLGKPAFDCSKVLERWRDGPAEDPDACGMGGGH